MSVEYSYLPILCQLQAADHAALLSIDARLAAPLTVNLAAIALPANAAQESGGHLAAIDTSNALINSKLTTTANGLKVDNSSVTQPISAASLPLPTGAASDALLQTLISKHVSDTATITASAAVALTAVQIIGANPNRKGLLIYNNGANTAYIAFGGVVSSATRMTLPILTFATYSMPFPIYTGAISAIRNAGTGTMLVTELT